VVPGPGGPRSGAYLSRDPAQSARAIGFRQFAVRRPAPCAARSQLRPGTSRTGRQRSAGTAAVPGPSTCLSSCLPHRPASGRAGAGQWRADSRTARFAVSRRSAGRHLPGDLGDNEEHARDYRDLSSRAHLDSFRWWIDEARLATCLVAGAPLASSHAAAVSRLMLPNPPPNTRPVMVSTGRTAMTTAWPDSREGQVQKPWR
jgi:hypothetical protein